MNMKYVESDKKERHLQILFVSIVYGKENS